MMKLEWLRIDKFRNVKPGSEIRFADGFNIVLGRNGTGKTTLLDLISRIVRWDFGDLERDEFAIVYELTLDDFQISVELANRKMTAPLMAPFSTSVFSGKHERMVVGMVARILGRSEETTIEVVNGRVQNPERSSAVIPIPTTVGTPEEAIAALGVALMMRKILPLAGGPIRGRRFDESLDLFRLTWGLGSFPGKIFLLPDGDAIALGTRSLLDELLQICGERYRAEPTSTSFTVKHEQLRFLERALQHLGFASSELQLDVVSRSGRQTVGAVELGNMIARFYFADGGFITQDRLSYGQKRLLMFYYYIASNPDIVIADELVNGLHHQWISACIDEIGERQAFLSSQNPVLLDYLPFSSAEHVRKSFVLCTSELDENQKPLWTWSNMTEEAATEFYSAYQVGIEHVSEILQSQGLF